MKNITSETFMFEQVHGDDFSVSLVVRDFTEREHGPEVEFEFETCYGIFDDDDETATPIAAVTYSVACQRLDQKRGLPEFSLYTATELDGEILGFNNNKLLAIMGSDLETISELLEKYCSSSNINDKAFMHQANYIFEHAGGTPEGVVKSILTSSLTERLTILLPLIMASRHRDAGESQHFKDILHHLQMLETKNDTEVKFQIVH